MLVQTFPISYLLSDNNHYIHTIHTYIDIYIYMKYIQLRMADCALLGTEHVIKKETTRSIAA
jgi:hypothetical protein